MSATADQLLLDIPIALRDVPAFPSVAAQLMQLISAEEDSFCYRKASDLVRADASFSAEVLRLANSPVFGFRHEVRDIPHALAVLGMNRLRAVVTTLAMREILVGGNLHDSVRRSWRHNLATALACELLSNAFWVDAGFGYTAGLLHDVGLLAMVATHSETYEALLGSTFPNAAEFLERERNLMGLDHCEAGHWLLTEWGLPQPFRLVASQHHHPRREETSEIVSLVSLGCATASMAGFPVAADETEWEPDRILQQLPSRVRHLYAGKLDNFPLDAATRINSFDCDFLT